MRLRSVRFTPAADRALQAAAAWSSATEPQELEIPELLLGLLAEPECRAAVMLLGVGVDRDRIFGRWPQLRAVESAAGPSRPLSAEVRAALATAQDRLGECLNPAEMATEHMLLGLVAAEQEFGDWLRAQGLSADALEAEVRRIYGYASGDGEPIELDDWPAEESAATAAEGGGDTPVPCPATHARELPTPNSQVAVLRILDAAANRATEGLRVIEDWVRFALDDRHLTRLCKQLRHELAAALAPVERGDRLASRDTLADVGAELTTTREMERPSAEQLLTANFQRVQEALRSLEEHAKLLGLPPAAGACESLRYRSYTLERAVATTRSSLERLAQARLYVLVDGQTSAAEAAARAAQLAGAGIHLLQLRDKRLTHSELIERALAMRQALAGSQTLLIINDRPEVALASGAAGVHLGQEDGSVKSARAILGPAALIGVSTHAIEQARRAVLEGANYLGVGPTFTSRTKSFEQFPGLDYVRQVAAEIALPAFAIGGITADNAGQVRAAGLSRVAVSAAVSRAADPTSAARELLARLR
jgi:thiamine-phosphate pyrophosphorylase